MSKQVITGQLVAEQVEVRHASAQPELRRDITCATRRSFLVLLTGQFVVLQLYVLHGCAEAELRRDVACAARRSFLDCGTLVYQKIYMSNRVTIRCTRE